MRARILLFVVLLVFACRFDDPPLGDTHFLCDANHPCPAGQTCEANVCVGDAGVGDADGPDGVACGSVTCMGSMVCCVDTTGSHCINAGDACDGQTATCDGPEDCAPTTLPCCIFNNLEPSCLPASTCDAVICHTAADCPNPQVDECLPIDGHLECF